MCCKSSSHTVTLSSIPWDLCYPHAVSGNTFKVNLAFELGQRLLLWLLRRTNHRTPKVMVIENNRFCVLPCAALNCTQNQMYTASLCAEQPVLAGVWVSAGSHRAPLPKLHTHSTDQLGLEAQHPHQCDARSERTNLASTHPKRSACSSPCVPTLNSTQRQTDVCSAWSLHPSEGRNKCRTGNGWRTRRTAAKRLECLPS